LVLLYSPEGDKATERQRWAQLPLWQELTDGLRDAGLLVANGALHRTDIATTVRVQRAVGHTKEVLAGFYVLDCDGLDEALRHAARFPTARYGSVEVRPIMEPTGDDPLG